MRWRGLCFLVLLMFRQKKKSLGYSEETSSTEPIDYDKNNCSDSEPDDAASED